MDELVKALLAMQLKYAPGQTVYLSGANASMKERILGKLKAFFERFRGLNSE